MASIYSTNLSMIDVTRCYRCQRQRPRWAHARLGKGWEHRILDAIWRQDQNDIRTCLSYQSLALVFHLVFRCTLLMFWYVLFIFFKFVKFSTCKAVLDASTLVTTLCLLAHFWKGTISSISQRIRRVAMFSMLTSMIKLRMPLVTHIATYCHIVPQSATECH